MTSSPDDKSNLRPLIQCLSDCSIGTELTVIRVDAGRGAKSRLAHLGIVPGVKITKKKSAPLRGPVEIIVKGANYVLGRGLALKIIVDCGQDCHK